MGKWFPILGLGFAVAGASKLLRLAPQRRLFRSWGWSEDAMRAMGAVELVGGLLVARRGSRQVAGAALTASSIAALAAELDHGDDALAPARSAMLLAALTALL